MIVIDLEFSGLNFLESGIWQIGAIELENPKNVFFDECRIDDGDSIEKEALEVVGKTESYLRDKGKQSQKQLLEKFFKWCGKAKLKNFACQGPQWDVALLILKANKYGLKFPMHRRAFDLHSIASMKYIELNKKLLAEEGHSAMGIGNICRLCGMKDERGTHNALEDAKLAAECLSRIIYGKQLLDEYKKFKIPEYLKKQ
ncbi:MAG: exonuclease domain-containing protein [Candidatus Paceibacterota bacterium]